MTKSISAKQIIEGWVCPDCKRPMDCNEYEKVMLMSPSLTCLCGTRYSNFQLVQKEVVESKSRMIDQTVKVEFDKEEIIEERPTNLVWEFLNENIPDTIDEITQLLCSIDDGDESCYKKLRKELIELQNLAASMRSEVEKEMRMIREAKKENHG